MLAGGVTFEGGVRASIEGGVPSNRIKLEGCRRGARTGAEMTEAGDCGLVFLILMFLCI